MRRFQSIILLILLPLVTLTVGWRLRGMYEAWLWEGEAMEVETGSGTILSDPEEEADISLLWSVWRLLQRHYIDPGELQAESMINGAIRGLVAGVGDPYTAYMPPKENAQFHQALEGTLTGIGAELILDGGAVTVVAPLRGSPAERVGLLPDDIIAEVDGQKVDGLTLDDVVSRIRGKKGTTVTLLVYRGDNMRPLTLSIVREDISVPSVEWKILASTGGQVGYVALNQFGEHSMKEMKDALWQIKDKSLAGIILDLRFNGGGYLDGAVELTSMFLGEGDVVTVESRDKGPDRLRVSGDPVFPDLSLAVLVNQASASASEIVAGALQDHGRATIVGMQSYGKGTVQEVIDLPGGGSLRVTTSRWLTPKGKNLAKEGITPDVVIERGENDVMGKQDAQLNAAIQIVLSGGVD